MRTSYNLLIAALLMVSHPAFSLETVPERVAGGAPADENPKGRAESVRSRGFKPGIWGRVFAEDSKLPLVGVTVQAEGEHMRDVYHINTPFTFVSDADGYYEFTNLPADSYSLKLLAPGFEGGIWGYRVDASDGRRYRRDLSVSGTATVEGRVVNKDTRQPLAEATVMFMPMTPGVPVWDGPPFTCMTDSNGHFQFLGVPKSRCKLAVEKRRIYYHIEDSEGRKFNIASGEKINMEVLVTETWEVSVQVVDRSGVTIPNTHFRISVQGPDGTWQRKRSGMTGASYTLEKSPKPMRIETTFRRTSCNASVEVAAPPEHFHDVLLKLPCSVSELNSDE